MVYHVVMETTLCNTHYTIIILAYAVCMGNLRHISFQLKTVTYLQCICTCVCVFHSSSNSKNVFLQLRRDGRLYAAC